MRGPDRKTLLRIALVAAIVPGIAVSVFAYPRLRAAWHHHRLVERLESRDPAQRVQAAVELAGLGDNRVLPVLVAALEAGEGANPDAQMQMAALRKLDKAAAVSALDAALRRPGAGRVLIIEALAGIDDPSARTSLAKLLKSEGGDLLQETVMALSWSRDPRLVTVLANAETQADIARKRLILAALTDPAGRALDPRLTALLEGAASDPDAATRNVARETLRWNALNRPGSDGIWADDPKAAASGDDARTDLAAAAGRASAFLVARQDPAGFWRTYRTHTPLFERVAVETNTYLTPVMVDMLGPVAANSGLAGNLAKARTQISSEIENGGLVRYYGSGAGPAGADRICAIAFDADDTALAWRIAPGPDPRMLQAALGTLARYRAPNGLYRTWLSETDGQHCIDRGRDPNPTDVGIQMHVLMLLARASPAEGQALCASLARAIDDDRIWVYYQHEPLIPMIRQIDLAALGCSLHIPDARIRTDAAGQGQWLAAARSLQRASHPAPGDRTATIALLRRLAQGDFAAIRRAPPLIYQNDSSGRVPAFYWSQEFGYALWLRLYYATIGGGRPHG